MALRYSIYTAIIFWVLLLSVNYVFGFLGIYVGSSATPIIIIAVAFLIPFITYYRMLKKETRSEKFIFFFCSILYSLLGIFIYLFLMFSNWN